MYYETLSKVVLENCLRIVIRKVPSRTMSIGVFVDHGVKDESFELNGISHFIEHMIFNYKNLEPISKKKLANLLDNGAIYEAYTGKEMTRCTLSTQRQYFKEMIGALASIIKSIDVLQENLEHERSIILQEMDTYFSSGKVKEELVEQALWGNRSLGLFVLGLKQNVHEFNVDAIQERYSKFYVPQNTHLVIQGDIEVSEVMDVISSEFNDWKYGMHTQDVLIEVEPSILGVANNGSRLDLTIAFAGPSFYSKEKQAMNLLSDILGRGLKSRLFEEIRERLELCYSIYTYTQTYSLSGYLAICVNCAKDKMESVYKHVLMVLEDIKLNGVTEEELNRSKSSRITHLLQIPNNTSKLLQLTGRYALLHKDFFVDVEVNDVKTVTVEDVKKMAIQLFTEDKMAISSIGAGSEELSILV